MVKLVQGVWIIGSRYKITDGGKMLLDEEEMRAANDNGELLFDEVQEKEELNIIIEEVPEDDDTQVKRWRIQLDVTTTRKKLKEIES